MKLKGKFVKNWQISTLNYEFYEIKNFLYIFNFLDIFHKIYYIIYKK